MHAGGAPSANEVVLGMDLTTITDDCLERLARGESVADCLTHYPEAAERLAPMLSAAMQLRVLSQARLTDGQRLRAKVVLREELAAQRTRREQSRHALGFVSWVQFNVASLAAIVAVVVFATVAFSTVAASQPGDLVYPLRVAVERAPAIVQPNPARRAEAELAAADRRLSDLKRDDAAHSVAVDALLSSDQAAVERSLALTEPERAAINARVAAHAAILAQLADQATDPVIADRLRSAADEALGLVGRSRSMIVVPPATPTGTATPTPQPSPTRTSGGIVVTPSPTAESGGPDDGNGSASGPFVTPLPSPTPGPRPTLSVVPPAQPTSTPTVPPGEVTPETRPTLRAKQPTATFTPGSTLVVPAITRRPTFVVPTIVVPTIVVPTIVVPTIVIPTIVIPTVVVPTIEMPTGTPGRASVNTPTPSPTTWWPVPSVTSVIPTRVVPTAMPTTIHARPTATTVWATFTPAPAVTPESSLTPLPTSTPRTDIRLTVTATVLIPQRPTATPGPTQTPRRPRTDTPAPTDIPPATTEPTTPTPPPLPR